jgi:TRAP-type mannitol/chloroaromatic compound transport system substrate-binding protein
MANITLGNYEIKNLRKGLAVKYEQIGRTLEYKKSRSQYTTLCSSIRSLNKQRDPKSSVSEDQLMSLFMDDKKRTFKDDFIDSCYFYAYDMTQESYQSAHQEQFVEWLELENQNKIEISEEEPELAFLPNSVAEKPRVNNWIWAASGLGLGLLLTFFYTKCAKKTEPITWYMTTSWDGNTSFISEALRDLTAEVYRETKGEFRIMVSNNLQLPDSGRTIKMGEIFNLLNSNAPNPRIQMLHSSKYYYQTEQSPSALFFSAIPFGMDYPQTKKWIGDKFLDSEQSEWGEGYRLWRQINEKSGVISFPCGHSDAQWGGWYKKPIQKIEDFKEQKVRISGFAGHVLDNLGATTCSLYQYQLLQAMQSDTLFAAEWINAVDDYRMGLYKARAYKFVNNETWNEPNSMFELTINRKVFQELPERFQKILVDAIKGMNKSMSSEFAGRGQTEKYENLIAKEGVQYFKMPVAVRDTLEKTTRRLLYEHVQKNKKEHPEIETIYASYLNICPNLKYTPPQ